MIEDGRYQDKETHCEIVEIKDGAIECVWLIAHDVNGHEYWEEQRNWDEEAYLGRMASGEFEEGDD